MTKKDIQEFMEHYSFDDYSFSVELSFYKHGEVFDPDEFKADGNTRKEWENLENKLELKD